jgi:hypothetical protein
LRTGVPAKDRRGPTDVDGWFDHPLKGPATEVGVHKDAEHPGFAAAHEIGHLLDRDAIGQGMFGSKVGSVAPHGKELADLMDAIQGTTRAKHLARLAAKEHVMAPTLMGSGKVKRGLVRVKRQYAGYLNSPDESFARAYAQFIAIRSGDPRLLAGLNALTYDGSGVNYMEQYSDEDFARIEGPMERLLEKLGWMERHEQPGSATSSAPPVALNEGRHDATDDFDATGGVAVDVTPEKLAALGRLTVGSDGVVEDTIENTMILHGCSARKARFILDMERSALNPSGG